MRYLFLLLSTSLFAATYSTDFLEMRNAGSASVPSISLRSDTDTGIYWPATNTLGITAGGSEAARFVSGAGQFPDGSASVPSISFSNDTTTNTGFYRVGENSIGITTGGTLRGGVNSSGNFYIGTTAPSGTSLYLTKGISGSTTSNSVYTDATVGSGVTSAAYVNRTNVGTDAASFTLPTLRHYFAGQGTFGVGSTVTNQGGFWASSGLIGATENYGFRGDLNSNSARWNLYMAGTAQNYILGNVGIGSGKTAPAVALDVAGQISSDTRVNTPDVRATSSAGLIISGSGGATVATAGAGGGQQLVVEGAVQSKTSLMLEDPGAGTNSVTVQAPTLAGNYTLTLPVDDGTTGQSLITNGSGVLSWTTPAGGGDVVGPGAAVVSGNVVTWNGTSGTSVQDSGLAISTGTYVFTAANLSNISSVGSIKCMYMRIGNIIDVACTSSIDLSASSTEGTFTITLPISRTDGNFAATDGCSGVLAAHDVDTASYAGRIKGDVGAQRCVVSIPGITGTAKGFSYRFMYSLEDL
jgi:hypothetical protein